MPSRVRLSQPLFAIHSAARGKVGIPERFAPPVSIDAQRILTSAVNDRLIDATKHGASCINFKLPPPYDTGYDFLLGPEPVEPQSEDCLNMDIYVPDGDHRNLPVLFFTPGGGFLVGASFIYDMRPLVQHGAEIGKPFIAIVVNYRLGPLGMLNPSTTDEWNMGLLDQIEALRFVKKHIRAFGGSLEKVTISGESAGAESTMHQMLFTDESLFRAAWLMSVPSSGAPFIRTTLTDKDSLIQSYAGACGCSSNDTLQGSLECLQTVDVDVLQNASEAWEGSGTSLGGMLVRDNVFRRIRDGAFPKVPMVFSVCRDEGTPQALGFQPESDAETASAVWTTIPSADRFNDSIGLQIVQEFLQAYPNDPFVGCPFDGTNTTYSQSSQFKRMAAIFTDTTFTEAWTEYLQTFSKHTSVWGFLWNQAIPGPGVPPELGIQHGSDLPFYFPSLLGPGNDPRSKGLGDLVRTLHRALVNFVVDLDPNGGQSGWCDEPAEPWPKFAEEGKIIRFDARAEFLVSNLPYRPGFEVLRRWLRPDGF
ncbi:alpha/beta-hydrolase [Polychaeton citri CBS 116435]|uniref:Carboxylic ester hydrolase n=1 Tax=Polychaeton citri CBS 116435 TaxID=1314669 RepID=A0A9P4Q5X2_9PEZI|nr:alpha/beta-hydrolase [Polychaeton citri CBS 116435]